MPKVHSKALNQTVSVSRIISHLKGKKPGPIVIFLAGIHGNEPSGVFALKRVTDRIKANGWLQSGEIYAITGHLWALETQVRFDKEDLNRQWTHERLAKVNGLPDELCTRDELEQKALYALISEILRTHEGPFYFMDLHTTSSETIPFMTVNDSLLNRAFTKQYPLPIVLGIEEYLTGPILSYINELGYVAFGYEGGQHDDLSSIENHESFIYLTLAFCQMVDRSAIHFDHHFELLKRHSLHTKKFYEILHRQHVTPGDTFKMNPGYVNFQRIHAGEQLATARGKQIQTTRSGRIFMPLYQCQGEDGFYVIQPIKNIFLRLSKWLRQHRADRILPYLPGVRWAESRGALLVDRRIARLFTRQIFHLLGYRSKSHRKNFIVWHNRENAARNELYADAEWNH